MKYCTKCGKASPDQPNFCQRCGGPLVGAAVPQETAAERPNFANTWLGLVPLFVMFMLVLSLGALSTMFYSAVNLQNLFRQCAIYMAIAAAVTLTVRAKGPDLSIAATASITSLIMALWVQGGGFWLSGLLIALMLGAGIGTLNGLLAIRTPLPPILSTLIVCITLKTVSQLIFRGSPVPVELPPALTSTAETFIFIASIAVIVFLLIFFTKLGVPFDKRPAGKRLPIYFLSYLISGVIATFAGYYMLTRLSVAYVDTSFSHELFIIFIASTIYASRAFDNKVLPLVGALLAAWAWAAIQNALMLVGINSFIMQSLLFILFAVMLIIAVIAQKKRATRLFRFGL